MKRAMLREMVARLRWVFPCCLLVSWLTFVVVDAHVIDGVSAGTTWQGWVFIILFWLSLLALWIMGKRWARDDKSN